MSNVSTSVPQSDVDILVQEELTNQQKTDEQAAAQHSADEPEDATDDAVSTLVRELANRPKAQPQREKAEDQVATTANKPRNHQEWHSVTQANVFRVEALTRHVFDQVNQNSAAEQAARKAMQEHAKLQKEKQRVKVSKRVKIHQEFIRKTYKCMKEIDHAVTQAEGAINRCIAERYQRFAQSKVSEYRLELRTKRPPQECFKDGVQRLLEKELEALSAVRRELMHEESEAKRLLEELKLLWNVLAKDIGNRRLAMRHDLGTVCSGEDSALFSSEDISERRSDEIVENAYKISAEGLKTKDTSESLVKRAKSQGAVLNKQVQCELARHTKELADMKLSLAQRIVESEAAIDKAGTQLRHMEQRAEMGDKTMNEMIATLKALLRDLHGNRQNSVKDLRNKSLALDIDNSCRKVTAQVASAAQEPANTKKLGVSASAPNLGASSKMSASGTAWNKPENSGNPQQGDLSEQRQAKARARPHPSSSPNAGGSNPLKAGAAAVVQGHRS